MKLEYIRNGILTVIFLLLPYVVMRAAARLPLSEKLAVYMENPAKTRRVKNGMALSFLLPLIGTFAGFCHWNFIVMGCLYVFPFVVLGVLKIGREGERNRFHKILAVLVCLLTGVFLIINGIQFLVMLPDFREGAGILFLWQILLGWIFNLELAFGIGKGIHSNTSGYCIPERQIFLPNCIFAAGFMVACIVVWYFARAGFRSAWAMHSIFLRYMRDPVQLLNLLWLTLLVMFFYCALGMAWGSILSFLVFGFLFLSNALKLKYHNTFFNWYDLFQIKEMILMGRQFVTRPVLLLFIGLFCVVLFCVFKFRRKILHALRPSVWPLPAVVILFLLTGMTRMLFDGKFEVFGIYARTWENETVNVKYNGLIFNQLLNLRELRGAIMKKPEDYTEERANQLKDQFAFLSSEDENVNPDVILILAESWFDLANVDGISLDKDISATARQYSPARLITSRFGGYTSAIEFETLTGLSLAFMPDALTPYTTYFNNADEAFPSVARELGKNGYIAKAMHPDLPDFYNRSIVYRSMGFDEYLAINDFVKTEENTTENGWLLDDALGNKIISELQEETAPQFIFALTMEEHYVTLEKYKETDVHVSSSLLEEKDRYELEQQAQSYCHTDQMIRKLIDYMNETDRPTLLYVYGDHLPPVDALGKLGYLDDPYRKYGTQLVMYSNYKGIDIDAEYISPNQIAAQIMHDSGTAHSGYYDYIYDMRKTYPVVHKEFVDITDPGFDIYRFIQYDILFGNRWLAEP